MGYAVHKVIRNLIILFFSFFLFSTHLVAMSNDEYEKINKLVEQQNIEAAFAKVKSISSGKKKLEPKTLLILGKIYLELEKPKKAKEYFEKVLFSSTQYDGEAKAGIALSELKMGNFLEAKQLSTDATNLNPDDVYSKIIYAMAHASALTDDEEEKLFLNAMEAAGQSTFAGRKYVEILLRKNRIKEAEEILKKTIIQNSLDAPSMELYSNISWLKGNSEEAIKYRIDAEQAYRNAGNIIKADQIVRWLNFEAVPNIEIKVIEKPKPQNKENISEDTKIQPVDTKPAIVQDGPKIAEVQEKPEQTPNRKVFDPLEAPEPINIDPDKDVITGSGTIIANGREILTNRHVVEGLNYIIVRNGLGEVRRAEGVTLSEENDLAIVYLERPFSYEYAFSVNDFRTVGAGEQIYVMGYPMASTFGSFHPTITTGIVSNATGFAETPGEFQITAGINPGNSGGPIFNKFGKIVGVATGGIDKSLVLEEEGFIPDGINFGVNTPAVLDFLSRPVNASSSIDYEYDAQTLYRYMRSSVVFIVGQE